jgi:hypothetical protein
MSKTDKNLEDLIQGIYLLCDYARLGYSITHQNSCNDCKLRDCKYRPEYGTPVRWNCPLWKG